MAKRKKSKKRLARSAVRRTGVLSGSHLAMTRSRSVSPHALFQSPLRKYLGKPTRLASYHSRNRKGEALTRLSLHRERMAAVPSIAEKHKPLSKLSLAHTVAEPDKRKSSEKAREVPHCKKRPDSKKATRGSGGSKRFVPWCG